MSTDRKSRPRLLTSDLPPIRCEPDLLARVHAAAQSRGVTVAEYGRAAWLAAVERDEQAQPTGEQRIALPPGARSVMIRTA